MATIDYLALIEVDTEGNVFRQMTCLFDPNEDVHNQVTALVRKASQAGIYDKFHVIWSRSDSYGDEKHADGKDVFRVHSTVRVI